MEETIHRAGNASGYSFIGGRLNLHSGTSDFVSGQLIELS
jgi:hypothetical protein